MNGMEDGMNKGEDGWNTSRATTAPIGKREMKAMDATPMPLLHTGKR